MPTPRTSPALYRAATAAIFALAALGLVALGVRLGTSGLMSSSERSPAGGTDRARATFVDIDRPTVTGTAEEVALLAGQLSATLPPSDRDALAELQRRAAASPGASPVLTPRDKLLAPEQLLPLDQPLSLPATPSPVAPVVDPLVSPVLDLLAGRAPGPAPPQPADPLAPGLLESLLGGLLQLAAPR